MKYIVFSLMLLGMALSSCTNGLDHVTIKSARSDDCQQKAKFALKFANSGYEGIEKSTTRDFQRALNALYKKVSKSPIGFLDFDPIVDGQDTPPKGFSIDRCMGDGYVLLRGIDWKDVTLTVRVVNTKDGYKVDGSGVVNIPKEKQRIP